MFALVFLVVVASLGPAPASAMAQGDVIGSIEVEPELIGVGGKARPGEWTGLRVVLDDFAQRDELREVVVRLALDDPDKDEVVYVRTVASRGQDSRPVWLYFRAPFAPDWSRGVRVDVVEADERGRGTGDFLGQGFAQFERNFFDTGRTLIGVVGRRSAGINELAAIDTQGGVSAPVTAHEIPAIAGGLRVADLPDRWMGLAALDVLLWTGSGPDEGPEGLTPEQTEAIEEWVRRGGHLVVALPATAQGWLRPGSPLEPLMPRVEARRIEGADLEMYRYLLTTSKRVRIDPGTLHVLEPVRGADRWDAVRLLEGPTGDCVAARRSVGAGMVTLVGLPVSSRGIAGVVQADVFWNRVLGKRAEVMTQIERRTLANAGELRGGGRGATIYIDEQIGAQVQKNAAAAAGLLLALVVFSAFGVLAVASYFVLGTRGLRQHSWLVFVLITGVFAGIAWGGATAIRQRDVDVRHLTFLDQVYGQTTERSRSWFTAFLPGYGSRVVELEPAGEGPDARFHQALAPWQGYESGRFAGFPDKRSYEVDSGNPSRMDVPSRSTVKQFRADVLRTVQWKGPAPVIEDASVRFGEELRIIEEELERGGTRWRVSGKLKHQLPGDLRDVRIVFVRGQQRARGRPVRGQLEFEAKIVSRTGRWSPDEEIDLWALTGREAFHKQTGGDSAAGLLRQLASPRSFADMCSAWSFYSLLETPNPRLSSPRLNVIKRREGHELDMSAWLTQPCLIVIGRLDDAPAPYRLTIDGREAPTLGRTIVRWVYPLGSNAPEVAVLERTEREEAKDEPAEPGS